MSDGKEARFEFGFDENADKMITEWINGHECRLRRSRGGAIGGKTTFSFTPSNVGHLIEVKCACDKKLDGITVDEWKKASFGMVGEEAKKVSEWLAAHPCPNRPKLKKGQDITKMTVKELLAAFPGWGLLGAWPTYYFTPTTLGDAMKVKCVCGQVCDSTDYASW